MKPPLSLLYPGATMQTRRERKAKSESLPTSPTENISFSALYYNYEIKLNRVFSALLSR